MLLRFLMYEHKFQLKTFSRIYMCIDIKHNTILKIKHSKLIYLISIFVIKYSLSYKHISRGYISL